LVRLFPVLTFLSAALLFWVQPLLGKALLPLLGGAPGVWNVCMVCFQALLLGGYLYAHLLTKLRSPRRQMAVHGGLLLLGAFAMQIPPRAMEEAQVPPGSGPEFWLLWVVLRSVGVPFLILSATAPLLQRWWSLQASPGNREPFFLCAVSNAGSLIALLGFPVLLEPLLPVRAQFSAWSLLLLVLILGLLSCAVARWQNHDSAEASAGETTPAEPRPSWRQRLRWVVIALIPSSLLLGTTTRVTTDIASVPLLWVVPLAVYLGTFIVVFSRGGDRFAQLAGRLMPVTAVVLVFLIEARASHPALVIIAIHIMFLAVASLVCHGRLASDRPHPAYLTSFYLCLAIGGVLGGSFNALLAPLMFSSVAEYPVMLLLACLVCRPRAFSSSPPGARELDVAFPFTLALLAVGLALVEAHLEWKCEWLRQFVVLGLPSLLAFLFAARPLRFTLGLAAVMAGGLVQSADARHGLFVERNFFGICRVSIDPTGRFRRFIHGNTLHGRQFIDPSRACEPLAYYHETGPFGQIMRQFQSGRGSREVAVVGLGAGASAAYGRTGEAWTFYEIDPAVARIAQDTNLFTFLNGCTSARWRIVLGDARLRLREARPGTYGLIVLDAFSSDAIPVHLLTREAMDLYLRALAPGGLIAVHISNRSIDLAPMLGRMAVSTRLVGRRWDDDHENGADGKEASDWVVLARNEAGLNPMAHEVVWKPLESVGTLEPWTDDFSTLWDAIKWK
jgi:hypothetical protein